MQEQSSPRLSLEHRYGVDGILYLSASGRIENEELENFARWTDEVKALIRGRAEAGDVPVLVLSDISKVTHFERKPIAVLRELLSHDAQYELRSAIVGGSRFATLVLDSIVSILHRNDMRHFKNKDEALKWLLDKKRTRT
jgi:hypothetical protein